MGLALSLGAGIASQQTKSDWATGFARVEVPGAITVSLAHNGTYFVYAEGTACLDSPNCHGVLYPVSVTVKGPDGAKVAVESTHGPTYMIGGMEGVGVARFDAASPGDYLVTATTGSYSEGSIAVGEAFPTWTGDWVLWLILALSWIIGAVLIVAPIVAYRRRRARFAARPEVSRSA